MTFETADLAVRYGGAERRALDGVTMRASTGSMYAVLGPNGSGKSTLMKVIMGRIRPEAGSARIGEREARDWPRRALARAVGAVAQTEPLAFPMTVRDFVAMGRYPHLGPLRPEGDRDRSAVMAAMARCDVSALAERDVTQLSGGELQRTRIARALAQEPTGLILDEPTASLDIRHEMTIFQLLRGSVDAGMTVLLITHNINLAARFADRFLLLDGGRVAAEGTAKAVFQEEILERVYRWPVAVEPDPVSGMPRVTPLQESSASRTKPT